MSNKTHTIPVTDEVMSSMFAGYVLDDAMLDSLVDQGFDYIMFVDPNRGRYLSSIEDWQERGVMTDGFTHLRQSVMDRV